MSMDSKKGLIRFLNKCYTTGRDTIITSLLTHFGCISSATFYNIITSSSSDVIIATLATKLGANKILLILILSFII